MGQLAFQISQQQPLRLTQPPTASDETSSWLVNTQMAREEGKRCFDPIDMQLSVSKVYMNVTALIRTASSRMN